MSDDDRERLRRHVMLGEIAEGEALARQVRERALAAGDLALASEAARRLGEFAWERFDTAEATSAIEEAYELRRRAGDLWPETNYLASCLAVLYHEAGRAADSRAMERIARAELPADTTPERRRGLSELVRSLASLVERRREFEEALRLSRRGLELLERAPEADELEVASACVAHGMCLQHAKDEAAARRLYDRALAIRLERLGPDHVYTGFTLDHLAGHHLAVGERDRARDLFGQGLEILERRLGPDHPSLATPLVGLAAISLMSDDPTAALVYAERAVGLEERAHGPSSPRLASTLQTLALIHAIGERPDRSAETWQRIVAILAPFHASHAEPLREAINNTFFNLARLGRHDEALTFANALLDRWSGQDVEPDLHVMLLNGASQSHFHAGRHRTAEKFLRRAIGLAERRFGSHALQLDPLLSNLAEVLRATGRKREAEEIERRRRGIRSQAN